MFDDLTGFKSACVTVLRVISENDGFNIVDKDIWLCVPLYQSLLYSLALEKDFWHFFRENGDTNEFDCCIAQADPKLIIISGHDSLNILRGLKDSALKDMTSRDAWYESCKGKIYTESSYQSSDSNQRANQVYLIEYIRHSVVHAHTNELENIYKFLTSHEGNRIFNEAVWTTTKLICEICLINNTENGSDKNLSAISFALDFERKFDFWRRGAARYS